MTYVTIGNGEAALMNVPQVHPSAVVPRSQFPTTSFISSRPMISRLPYTRPQANYAPHVQTREINSSSRRGRASAKENKCIKDVFLTTFGILICAIPLAVVSTLYVQQHATGSSTSTSTIATVTGNTSLTNFTLPNQCNSYTTNNDSTRNVASGMGSLCDNTLTTGWYRFVGGAGTQLAMSTVSRDTCTTYYGGSYTGSLPLTAGTTTFGTLCLNNNGILCYTLWSGSLILVTNCSGYYVYYLSPIFNCNSRYCTTS